MDSKPLTPKTRADRVARNILTRYGQDNLQILVDSLRAGRSYREIARTLGISCQRVGQWAKILGQRSERYLVHPDIAEIARATVG